MINNHLYQIFIHWGTNIWVISDPHFGDLDCFIHRFVVNTHREKDGSIVYEDFYGIYHDLENLKCCLREADEDLVKNINRKVGKAGTLIILGDIGDIDYIKKIRASYKILIMGNHDKGASNYKRIVDYPRDENGAIRGYALSDNRLFDEVYDGPLMINDRTILSHERLDIPSCLFNIHGHNHAEGEDDFNHLNVTCEHIGFEPICLSALFKEGLLKNIPSIHRETIHKATERKWKSSHDFYVETKE